MRNGWREAKKKEDRDQREKKNSLNPPKNETHISHIFTFQTNDSRGLDFYGCLLAPTHPRTSP